MVLFVVIYADDGTLGWLSGTLSPSNSHMLFFTKRRAWLLMVGRRRSSPWGQFLLMIDFHVALASVFLGCGMFVEIQGFISIASICRGIGNMAILSIARHIAYASPMMSCSKFGIIALACSFLVMCSSFQNACLGCVSWLPCNVPLNEQIQIESQSRVIEKFPFDPRVFLGDLGRGCDPWLADSIHGWRAGGCLASWTRTLQRAEELGIARMRRISALTDTF
eukprot:3542338-Amphidinium_carterae.1